MAYRYQPRVIRNIRTTKFVCSRLWSPGKTFYVAATPGQGGKDWGYETESGKAIPISPYWKRRFMADMGRVNGRGVNCREVDVWVRQQKKRER